MKFSKRADSLLNICLPLTLGLFIYGSVHILPIPDPIRNYLPDGLWAYAFISCILLIWDRAIKTIWNLMVFITAVCFEVLQYQHAIPGTGDIKDVIIYILFFIIALLLNTYFKTQRFKHSLTISL